MCRVGIAVNRTKKGFTLVELIVVIVVIAVLAAVVVASVVRYQATARNAERESDISTITEALEKYYDENGEYPSCSMLSGSVDVTSNMLHVDQSALKSPRATGDNSFVCSSLNAANDDDNFAFVGDGSTTCQSGNACLGWTIQYRDDETGAVKTVKSRRTADLATSGATKITATVISNTQINLQWTAVPNATSYKVERSRSSSFSSPTTSSTAGTSMSHTGLLGGARYYFRVTPILSAANGLASTANALTTINTPTGTFTSAASLQSSNTIARGAASALSCPAGATVEYAIGYDSRNTNSSISISYPAWGTATTRDISAAQGYNYTFQSKAHCSGPDADSSEIVSSTSNVTRPINAPAAPVFTGDTSMRAGYRYMLTYNTSCPAGTSLSGTVNIWNTGLTGSGRNPSSGYYAAPNIDWWYLGWNDGQVWEDVYYYAIYKCDTDFTTSPNSSTSSTYITVDCDAGRRSFSANPRCDNYGQSSSSLPWGS